jgi:hypothetical protein
MAKKPKLDKPDEVNIENWEDEGDSHSCQQSQAWQTRTHLHSDGFNYPEQCQPLGGGTWGWRPI